MWSEVEVKWSEEEKEEERDSKGSKRKQFLKTSEYPIESLIKSLKPLKIFFQTEISFLQLGQKLFQKASLNLA